MAHRIVISDTPQGFKAVLQEKEFLFGWCQVDRVHEPYDSHMVGFGSNVKWWVKQYRLTPADVINNSIQIKSENLFE